MIESFIVDIEGFLGIYELIWLWFFESLIMSDHLIRASGSQALFLLLSSPRFWLWGLLPSYLASAREVEPALRLSLALGHGWTLPEIACLLVADLPLKNCGGIWTLVEPLRNCDSHWGDWIWPLLWHIWLGFDLSASFVNLWLLCSWSRRLGLGDIPLTIFS